MDTLIDELIASGSVVIPPSLQRDAILRQYDVITKCHFVGNLDVIPQQINGDRWRGRLQSCEDVGLGYGSEIDSYLHPDDRDVLRATMTTLEPIAQSFLDIIGRRYGVDLIERYRVGNISDTIMVIWTDFHSGDPHPISKPADYGLLNIAMSCDRIPHLNAGKVMLDVFRLLGAKNVYPGCRLNAMPPGKRFSMCYYFDPSLDWFSY